MAFSTGSAKGPKSEINVTPLVDVVLVLLIIFMVVTPMLQRGKDVKLPTAGKNQTPPAGDILVVSILPNKTVFIETEPTTVDGLPTAIHRLLKGRKDVGVLIKGDASLAVEDVRQVLRSAQNSAAAFVSLAVQEEKR